MLCFDSFLSLMDYSYNHGRQYISDEIFIQHGFPANQDP